MDGYKSTAACCIGGRNSIEKGRKTANAILTRFNLIKCLTCNKWLCTLGFAIYLRS